MAEKQFTLSQLSSIIKEAINLSLAQSVWVKAEISELHENRNGNCYLELIEKDSVSDKIVAKFRAIIWNRTYGILKPYFEQATNAEFKAGITVMLKVQVEFSDIYGISLMVQDIDPAFTIGDWEMRRAMVIQQLVADGVFEMNKELDFPLVPQRIAIISSETAAGFEDFCNQLNANEWGFTYHIKLFKAYMQGDLAEQSMIDALEKIPPDKFDLVVITRGGGSRSDLACFDTYNLANNVCQFPLPVISAIGHERDTSVVDLVSHTKMKTPTAAAAFIIEKTAEFWSEITNYFEQITDKTSNILDLHVNFLDKAEKSILNSKNYVQNRLQTLQYFSEKMQWIVKDKYQKRAQQLTFVTNSLFPVALNQLKFQQQKVVMLTKAIDAYNPQHILKKGYSITLKNGKTVRKETEVVRGDEVITILSEGKVRSIIR